MGTGEPNLQTEYELSFYEDLGALDDRGGARLVRDRRTRLLCVRKDLSVYHEEVYRALMTRRAAHVPQILWMGRNGEHLTVIEQYVNGTTLQAYLDKGRLFTEKEVRGILRQLCVILRDLHGRAPAIIHRDIKPSNVLVGQNGEIWLLDLDAAKPWKPGQPRDTELIGTPGYAAPEQYGFASSGAQADIYALGALANVLLTGNLPGFGIPEGELGDIIRRCCAMDPADRPMSAYELDVMLNGGAVAGWENAEKQSGEGRMRSGKRYYKYLPPGFRSLNPIHMVVGVLLYWFCIWMGTGTAPFGEHAPAAEILCSKILTTLGFLGIVLFTGNYLGVQERLPLSRSEKKPIRILGILIWDFMSLVIAIAILVILDDIFNWSI